MIIKQTKGKDLHAVLNYALEESHAPKIIGGNIGADTVGEASREFLLTLQLKPDIKSPVLHAAFSFEPGEEVSNRVMRTIGDEFLRRMGYELKWTQRIYVRHYDHEQEGGHPHFHLIASRIQLDSKLVRDSWDHYRGRSICRELEGELNLKSVAAPRKLFREPTRWEGMVYQQSGVLSGKMDLQRKIFDAAQAISSTSNEMGDLIDRVTEVGIGVLPWRNPQTQQIDGISFRLGDFVMRGESLGAAFTWAGLQHYLGINYDPERDTAALQRAEQSELSRIRDRLESQWGSVESFSARFTKRCQSPERLALESPALTPEQRESFVTHNYQLLATGFGVEYRRTQQREASPPGRVGVPDSSILFEGERPTFPNITFRYDLIDFGAVRAKIEALGHDDREVERDPSSHPGSPGVDGGDRSGSRIYPVTLELRNRVAALLRGGADLPQPTGHANPAGSQGVDERSKPGLGGNSGGSATGISGSTDSSHPQRATDPGSRTLDTGASGTQEPAAGVFPDLSIREQIQQRIQEVTGYTTGGTTRPAASTGEVERTDCHEHESTASDRPPTTDGGNRNPANSEAEPLSLREQIQQRIQQVTGYSANGTPSDDRAGGGSSRRTQPTDSDSIPSRPGRRDTGADSSTAIEGRNSASHRQLDPPGNLSQSGATPVDAGGRSLGDRHSTSTHQRSDGDFNENGGISQTPGEYTPTVARQDNPVDEDLRRANRAGNADQFQPAVSDHGDRAVEEAGDRFDQTNQDDKSESSGYRRLGQEFEPIDEEETADERRLQLDGGGNGSDWISGDRRRDPLQLRQSLYEENTADPTDAAIRTSGGDSLAVATYYAALYARYNPDIGDVVQDDLAIATAALADQYTSTEVACILTSSPLVQSHKENLGGVQSYIEKIIDEAIAHQQLDRLSQSSHANEH
jgi:hypothetical protein